MRRLSHFFGTLAAAAVVSGPALANTEIITAYDARSAGMGHTGTATINNAAATFANPANLSDIKHLDVTLHFAPNFTSASMPIVGTGGAVQTAKSSMLITPLAFAGLGYKLHPGVAVGLAAELTQVKGVLFNHTPLSLASPTNVALQSTPGQVAAAQLFWEVRAPVAVEVTNWLTVSAGYRMGFFHQGSQLKADAIPTALTKSSFHGQNFAGAQAGLLIKPGHNVRVGLSYRSKMVLLGSGDTTNLNPQNGQTATQHGDKTVPYVSPHMFTAGLSVKLLDSRLTLAGDFKYWLYKDAYSGLAQYRDAMSGHVGAEYMVTPRVPVRVGYLIGLSATRKDHASPVDTTPGLQNGGTLGAGYHLNTVDLDAAIGYGGSSTQVAPSATALPGQYKLSALLIALSATFHI